MAAFQSHQELRNENPNHFMITKKGWIWNRWANHLTNHIFESSFSSSKSQPHLNLGCQHAHETNNHFGHVSFSCKNSLYWLLNIWYSTNRKHIHDDKLLHHVSDIPDIYIALCTFQYSSTVSTNYCVSNNLHEVLRLVNGIWKIAEQVYAWNLLGKFGRE